MLRTHSLGELNASLIGQTVTVTGWVARRRDHGGVAFVDLRDASGFAQVVVRDEADFDPLRNEWVLQVIGTVERRPEGNENPNLPSGEIELIAETVTVLNTAAALPFQVDEHVEVGEEARLRHRYLDLRRAGPAAALRLRSKVNKAARDVLDRHDFVEVETPTLTRSTPEGARDFLVPARLQPGSWYALPQSPQLFKQLLMVAGMERYYQIARCYRDEDFRADRQPEFTQLDIELSFVEQDDVIALMEDVLAATWALIDVEIPRALRTDISTRVLTPAERAAVAALDPAARDAEVLYRFAAKEAIYKALDPWVQRLVSFQEVEIVTAPDGGREARLALARGEGPFRVGLYDIGALHGGVDGGVNEAVGDLVLVVAEVTPQKK